MKGENETAMKLSEVYVNSRFKNHQKQKENGL